MLAAYKPDNSSHSKTNFLCNYISYFALLYIAILLYILQDWIDYKLRWDPEEYGGIRVVRLPHDSVWKPDILLYNKYVFYYTCTR